MRARLHVGALLFAAASCGGGAPSGPADPGAFLQAEASAFCALQARCGAIAGSEVSLCVQVLGRTPQSYNPATAVADGRLAYDRGAAGRCLGDISAAACGASPLTNADCAAVYAPRVAPTGSCEDDGECVGGYCSGAQAGCRGTCMPTVAGGGACAATFQCEKGSFCDITGGSSGTCTAAAPPGGTGASCAFAFDCQSGLVCVLQSIQALGVAMGTCQILGTTGAACSVVANGTSADDTCAPGLACVPASYLTDGSGTVYPPVASGACQPRQAAGQACRSADDCAGGLACKGFSASPAGCTAAVAVTPGTCSPWLDAGGSCDPSAQSTGCTLDATCDPSAHACVLPGGPGATCASSGGGGGPSASPGCAMGSYCTDAGTCSALVPFGDACTAPATGTDPCTEGQCSGGACTLICM